MRGKERRTTIPCRATIPKYIVEKILSQGGTRSARPAGGRNWISATLLLGLVVASYLLNHDQRSPSGSFFCGGESGITHKIFLLILFALFNLWKKRMRKNKWYCLNLCAREREIFGEMRGKERRTTVSCRATIPKYIVEKILSQGGTGSARPAGGRNLKGCASLRSKPDEPYKSHSVERSKHKE